jgi:hypothetical protein
MVVLEDAAGVHADTKAAGVRAGAKTGVGLRVGVQEGWNGPLKFVCNFVHVVYGPSHPAL